MLFSGRMSGFILGAIVGAIVVTRMKKSIPKLMHNMMGEGGHSPADM